MNKQIATGLALVGAAGFSFAAGGPSAGDLSSLTPDLATVATSVLSIAGGSFAIHVIIKGIRWARSVL